MIVRRHVWVAMAIYLVVMAFFWFKSGDTVAVKLVDTIPVTLGFLAPALFLARGAAEFRSRFWMIFGVVILALLVHDGLLTLVVEKHRLFEFWFALYPFGAVLLLSLLFAHATLSKPMES